MSAIDREPLRLSSRLSVAVRLLYASTLVMLLAAAVVTAVDPPLPGPRAYVLSALGIVAVLLLGPLYLEIFAFRTAYLSGNHLVVRGLRTEWRIPVQQLGDVVTRTPRGWTMVRIALTVPIPGLGSRLRILGPFLQPSEFVAATIESAQRNARSGT